jgi:hypothetical protein
VTKRVEPRGYALVSYTLDMHETAIELLGRLVAREIRDNTIRNFDQYLRGKSRGKYAKAVWALYEEHRDDSKALLEAFIPVIVDETIGIFLQVFDEHLDRVMIQVDEGEELKSPYAYTDALEAEYRPEDGWIATYSQERPSKVLGWPSFMDEAD